MHCEKCFCSIVYNYVLYNCKQLLTDFQGFNGLKAIASCRTLLRYTYHASMNVFLNKAMLHDCSIKEGMGMRLSIFMHDSAAKIRELNQCFIVQGE